MKLRLWARFLAGWILLPGPSASCPAQSAPVTFGKALELAFNHNGTGHNARARREETAGARLCPVPLQNLATLAGQLDATNEMGLPAGGPDFTSYPPEISTTPLVLDSKRNILLCTALVYVKLEDLAIRKRLVGRQEELARRLMDIESRRVSAEVDHPLELTQAKMLRARTRMESASLDDSRQGAEAGLASLMGDRMDSATVVEGSMPVLAEKPSIARDDGRVLARLLAFRDLVQLEYVAAHMNRLKAIHDVSLARASIGVLVAAELEEVRKLVALVRFNNQVRMAKIQFAGAAGDLEDWAYGRASAEAGDSGIAVENHPPENVRDGATEPPSVSSPIVISLLIAPGIPELPVGKSQQYSAIATDGSGHARDVSAEATWSCSTDSGAVLSSTGLLTALSEGELTIRVEFGGMTNDRKLIVTPQIPDEDPSR